MLVTGGSRRGLPNLRPVRFQGSRTVSVTADACLFGVVLFFKRDATKRRGADAPLLCNPN